MTIQVTSHSIPEVVPASQAKGEVTESKEDKSAPVVDTTEQDSAESDAAKTEEKEATETEVEDESEDEVEETESKDSDKDKPKKKGGFQRRIDKLNARATAAQEQAEYWKQQALKGAGESKTEPKVEKPQVVDATGKPDPDSFETHVEYVEALTDWKIEQREKTATEKAQKTQLETEQQTLLKSHSERVKAFAEKTADFDDVLETVDDIQVSPTVREIIVSSDNGPELMFELAKNRAEYERINKLPPLAAARELGKIESKLAASSSEANPKQEIKKQTKAPPPLTPVSSKSVSKEKSIHDPDISQAEYERLRAKQRSG